MKYELLKAPIKLLVARNTDTKHKQHLFYDCTARARKGLGERASNFFPVLPKSRVVLNLA